MSEKALSRTTLIPDFGVMVPRSRLIEAFTRRRPRVTLIAAPAAYGKSVLASQLAAVSPLAGCWFHVSTTSVTSTEILTQAIAALDERAAESMGSDLVPIAVRGTPDLVYRLESLLSDRGFDDAPVVFDNLSAEASSAACELASAFAHSRTKNSYIVTVRSTEALCDCPISAWRVGARDLLLDDREALDMVQAVTGHSPAADAIEVIIRCSGRQPGLLSLLSRHAALDAAELRELDVSRTDLWDALWHLATTQLSPYQLSILRCMAVLGSGSSSDIATVLDSPCPALFLEPIAAAVPLVRLSGAGSNRRFSLHELAQRAFGGPSDLGERHDVLDAALEVLRGRGDDERIVNLVAASSAPDLVLKWLELVGFRVLRRGGLGILGEALQAVDSVDFVRRPRLLVLKAAHELETGSIEAAYRDSLVARELAEQENDGAALTNAMLVLAQATAGMCDYMLARTYVDRALALCGDTADSETITHLCGRRLAIDALFGDVDRFQDSRASLMECLLLPRDLLGASDHLVRFFATVGDVILSGNWSDAARVFESAFRSLALNLSLRVAAAYNFVGCMLEMGRVDEAEAALDAYGSIVANAGNGGWDAAPESLRAVARCARGDSERVFDEVRSATDSAWDQGERLSATTELTTCAVALLGSGRPGEALRLAESAARRADEVAGKMLSCPARLEEAAARLALDDVESARRTAARVSKELEGVPACHLHLRADLILAEIDCRNGKPEAAAARMREHVDYILSESANWQLAMNVRAFPRLLGPITAAVGAANLPVHMLNLIPPEYGEGAVAAARDLLEESELDLLSQRLLGRKAQGRRAADRASAEPTCDVRLFGGLSVVVDGRRVEDKAWRKRKARLLLAMLAVRCGKDVPRDQITEYLWPEMDEEAALNNLYVVWSAMKHALTPELGRGKDCPYVENRGGVCRAVQGRVTTDLDEFEGRLQSAARARAEEDPTAELTALQRIAEIYRGELLPGEAYDDWFASTRERCRHDYEDAMLRAAFLLESRGDLQGGLSLLRRALQYDPWREDLYQAALRLQMLAGQRSAAIETYLACRSRLVEDLGIDPSLETTKLYEQVLGMEEGPEPPLLYDPPESRNR